MKNKILIVTECFYPEEFKINDVAIEWKNKGYDVEVLTTVPSYPESEIYNGYKNKFYQKEIWNDITIHRVKAVTGYKTSLIKKLLKYFSFMFFGSILALKIGKKYDYIFGFQVGALSSMFPAILLQKFYKRPVTLWIQDIWPDSVYAYGFKKTKVLQYLLDKFVSLVYRHTSSFAITGQGFKNRVIPYVSDDQLIKYCPNWADELDANIENIQLSDDSKIHFTFAGNIGKVQNLENVISAFGTLDNKFINKAQLNIIGDGSELNNLKELVQKNNFNNILFHGRKPRIDMSKYLNASHFLIVSLVDKPIFSLTVPAKTQTYIAAKKPILAILKGDGAKIIKDNDLGYISDPNNLQDIQNIFIKAINTDGEQISNFTKNCDILNNTIFNKDNIINNLLSLTIKSKT